MGISGWLFGRTARKISRILNEQGLRALVLETGQGGLESHVVQVEFASEEGWVKLEFYTEKSYFSVGWHFNRWITRPSGVTDQLDAGRMLPQTTGNRMGELANAKPETVVKDMHAIGLLP